MRDYGYDLPDTREEYIDQTGESVKIRIVRHYYQPDDDQAETSFRVSFDIIRAGQTTQLPTGTDQSTAENIARQLYPEDEEASQEIADMRAEEAAERRAGA